MASEIIIPTKELYEQINTKISELTALLDQANAQALNRQQVQGKYKLSDRMKGRSGGILQELKNRKDLYATSIDRVEFEALLQLHDSIPTIVNNLSTCAKKAEGWRISVGQNIAATILYLHGLLKVDIRKYPDLKAFFEYISELFARKPAADSNGKEDTTSPSINNGSGDAAA